MESITNQKTIINDSNYTWFAYFTIAIGVGLAVLHLSGTNIAIPKIAEHFKIDIPTVQWVSLAYILTTSALFLPIGRLADTIGRKNIYIYDAVEEKPYSPFDDLVKLEELMPNPEDYYGKD